MDAKLFNQPLDWDTSKVATMMQTFSNADAFNQQLTWDTSKVTDFSDMVTAPPLARLAPPRDAPASASAPRRAPASSRATSPLSSRLPRPADAQFLDSGTTCATALGLSGTDTCS